MAISLPSGPSAPMLNLSALAYLLGVAIVTWCITRSSERYPVYSKKGWVTMPWSRIWLLSTLVVSWLYLMSTGVLLFGAPPEHNIGRCSVGTIVCIIIYGSSKGLVYLCLIERVHAVWGNGRARLRSPLYLTCMALLLPLMAIAVVMLMQGIWFLHNGYCVLGMSRLASILIMSYDTFTNFLLTFLFVAPLARSTIRSTRLRTIAIKAAIASFGGLLIEVINGFILFASDGKEIIWVCLGACAADIVANAVLLYWAMDGPGSSFKDRSHSVHFSTIQRVIAATEDASKSSHSTAEAKTGQKNSIFVPALRDYTSHTRRPDDVFSEDMTITSSEYVPTLEMPKPVLQGSSKALFLDQHPWKAGSYPCPTCDAGRSSGSVVKAEGEMPTRRSLNDRTSGVLVTPRVRRRSA